jgi:CHAD domain-containing protein
LRAQLDALTRELGGVRKNEDIEPVHQARVASRRLRAALTMFADCFDAGKIAQWQKRVKKLTRGLGAARDADVQIDFVRGFLSRLDKNDRKHRPGVARLLLRLQQRRDALQPEIIAILDKIEEAGILAEMVGELEKTLFVLRSHDVPLQSEYVFERAAAHIRTREKELLALEHTLTDPQDIRGHHQMRIAAKKVRYTMEICAPAYDGQLETSIDAVKEVQTLLGDIHDCDVWVECLDAFLEQERLATIQYSGHSRPFNRLQPGFQLVREERQQCRQKAFAELLRFWKGLRKKHSWGALEHVLEGRVNNADRCGYESPEVSTDAGAE